MSTTDAAAPSIRQLALGDLDQEMATTRRVLERVPDEHLGWKPHAKSFSLGDLATHIATLPVWLTSIVTEDSFDVAAPMPRQEPLPSRDAILAAFDEQLAAFRSRLDEADDATLGRTWEMRAGEKVVFALPKVAVLRSVGINHIVHHRGQLSVYLRVLDVPVPSIYGPSADERGPF
jgi:uncharacterized damage-inducible protein DinB